MRCPVCKADNADDVAACRRCKADLSLLVDLERRRAALIARAQQCLATGDGAAALQLAVEVERLRRDDQSRRLIALSRLLCRDFAGAWRVVAATPFD
jgi:hypothetical protein